MSHHEAERQAFSEVKASTLTVAKKLGAIELLEPPGSYDAIDVEPVFASADPSAVYNQSISFRHYLHCLRVQASRAKHASYDDAFAYWQESSDAAIKHMGKLNAQGVGSSLRSFVTFAIQPTKPWPY